MKFVSKMSNYRVILQHSTPAEPITGRLATPGIWVKFENGVADVRDEKVIEMVKNHHLFNTDFVIMDDPQKDPYEDVRNAVEPDHNITEIKYGHIDGSINPKPAVAINRETKKILMDMAKDMAKEMAAQMAPDLAKQMLKEVLSKNQDLVKGALAEASGSVKETEESDDDSRTIKLEVTETATKPKSKGGRPKKTN